MPGYAKIPEFIRTQIARCETDTFYVGRVRSLETDEIASGALKHLRVRWDGTSVTAEPSVVPDPSVGR